MREPHKISDVLQEFQHPLDTLTRPRTLYEDFIYQKDMLLGIDFEDKLIIYGTLLLFTWLCNTGIVMQLQFKKEVKPIKLVIYSILVPVALFMILIPILMYFEIWANYRALVFIVILSNFFIYFVTKSAIEKKQRLLMFSQKLNDVRSDLIKAIEKSEDKDTSDDLKKFKDDLEDFGPNYYNGV